MPVFWLFGLLIFALGAAVGSFLNVLVYRSIRGADWVRGRSACEHCGRSLRWYENIPLLSYVLLRGECARCHARIDLIHPFVELLTGSLFLWWYVAGSFLFRLSSTPLQVVQPLFWLAVGILCVIIFVSDVRYMLIPTWAVGGLTIIALVYRGMLAAAGAMQQADFSGGLIGALLLTGFFLVLWAVTKGKGFGLGDVQLAFPLGLIMGSWPRIVVAAFLAFVLGAAVGVLLVLLRKKKLRAAVPFGPFLLAGAALSLVWGYDLWAWYVRIVTG